MTASESKQLDIDDLEMILRDFKEYSVDWKDVGRQIRLTSGDLDRIATECGNNREECTRQMFTKWLRKGNPGTLREFHQMMFIMQNDQQDRRLMRS